MGQFDVFDNPISRARRMYPYVVVLQSDLAETGRDRLVAPLAPRARIPGTAGRLMPHVKVSGVDHVVLVLGMTAVLAEDLRDLRGQVARNRSEITAAVDYLFFGV